MLRACRSPRYRAWSSPARQRGKFVHFIVERGQLLVKRGAVSESRGYRRCPTGLRKRLPRGQSRCRGIGSMSGIIPRWSTHAFRLRVPWPPGIDRHIWALSAITYIAFCCMAFCAAPAPRRLVSKSTGPSSMVWRCHVQKDRTIAGVDGVKASGRGKCLSTCERVWPMPWIGWSKT